MSSSPIRPLHSRSGSGAQPASAAHLVIILSYGDPGRAIRCATSIRDGSASGTHHILVVRNHSAAPDGELPGFVADLPDADLLSLPTNRGFSGGMNAGLQWGIDHGFAVLTILNDDTIASAETFDALVAAAQTDTARVLCPRIEYLPPRQDPWFVGALLDPGDGLPRHMTAEEFHRRPRSPDNTVDVDVVTGCCVTATAAAWVATGGFDERYFLYFEDSDWSMQAHQVGLRLALLDEVSIQHQVSASSTGATAYITIFYYSRNLLLYGHTWPQRNQSSWRTWRLRSARPALRAVKRDPLAAARESVMSALGAAAWVAQKTGPAPAIVATTAQWMSRAQLTRPR